MVLTLLFLFLSYGGALAQSSGSSAPAAVQAAPPSSSSKSATAASADTAPSTAPNEAVIRIPGVCSDAAGPSCVTVVTREEFERLVKSLQADGQPLPEKARQNVAEVYADLLVFQQAAKKAGIEKNPEYQQLLRWQNLRELSSLYRRDLERKYRNPDTHDIHAYYLDDPSRFTEMKLQRILVPRKNPSAQNQEAYEKSALEAANEARRRAAQGDDMAQIQKETYARLEFSTPPPTVDLGAKRKASISAGEGNEVFSLQPGDVTQVQQGSFYFSIYKVVSKRLLPEESVKDEIARAIVAQRIENALRSVKSASQPELNPSYFHAADPIASPAVPSPR